MADISQPGKKHDGAAASTGSPTGILAGSSSSGISVRLPLSPLHGSKRSPANWRRGPLLNLKIPCKNAARSQKADAHCFFRDNIVGPASHQGRSLLSWK